MKEEQQLFERLIQSIQLLAADYKTQISSLPKFVHIPDELALIYHDCFLLADQIAEEGWIDNRQLAKLKELDDVLECMSEKDDQLWTTYALRNSSEWENIRLLAGELLELFNVKKQRPDLTWIQYVKGGKKERIESEKLPK